MSVKNNFKPCAERESSPSPPAAGLIIAFAIPLAPPLRNPSGPFPSQNLISSLPSSHPKPENNPPPSAPP